MRVNESCFHYVCYECVDADDLQSTDMLSMVTLHSVQLDRKLL